MQFDNLLKDKNVLVGVTGSIAIYKSLELIRLFIKSGASVRVIMSESAKKFITPLTFEAISQNKVLDESSENWSSDNNHIGIGNWADIFIIAPATANTINKLGSGISDNLLLQTTLAFSGITLITPAMNTNMLKKTIIERNLKLLAINGFKVISTQSKLLACNSIGDGAMAEPIEIFYETTKELLKDEFWIHRRVVITGGGTIEKIDDVRYLSNFSSGKMANAIAKALYLKGADVCFITTKKDDLPNGLYTIEVQSSNEMREYLEDALRVAKRGVLVKPNLTDNFNDAKLIQKEPYLFMVSAVSDYTPKFPQNGKLKKESLGDSWNLELEKNIDILKTINRDGIKTIGFKAEFDEYNALKNAKNMLKNKNLNAVCLNILGKDINFGSEDTQIEFLTKDKNIKIDKNDKLSVAFEILDNSKELN